MNNDPQLQFGHKLIRFGILLFLLGLLTGFAIPALENPRMALSSHLEAIMNGMFLVLLGLVWPKLRLTHRVQKWGYGLSLFGTYTNWISVFLAALWGAGAEMMPIAGTGYSGAFWQEVIIKFGLISLSVAMVAVCFIVLLGLRGSSAKQE